MSVLFAGRGAPAQCGRGKGRQIPVLKHSPPTTTTPTHTHTPMGDPTRHPEPESSPREHFSQPAMRDESAADAASPTAVSRMNPFAALAAFKYASESEAEITETVDLETPHARQLSEQRRALEGRCAIALGEQERQLRREFDSMLQIQKQQFDEERDNALQTQKQELEQTQKELQEDKDVAESALIKERQDRYFIQQTLLHKITKASKYFGYEMPEDFDFIDKVDMAFQLGKLNASRVCRRAFDELSERLNVRLEQWPLSEEIFFQEHTDEYMALLTSQVDRIVQACDDRIGTEQCRTTDVQRASLISKVMVTEQASNAIRDLRAQLAAKDKLWGQVATSLEACLAAKDQQIDALTERLRLQTQILDERHVLLERLADAAATPVG